MQQLSWFPKYKKMGYSKRKYWNGRWERSSTYRDSFFRAVPPGTKSGKYICVYCGRRLPKRKVQVDHLYPVSRVKKSRRLQRRLERLGIHNVNDVRNLVPSCEYCNKHKAQKMGLWILRGKIGRINWLWPIRHALHWGTILFLIYLLYSAVCSADSNIASWLLELLISVTNTH